MPKTKSFLHFEFLFFHSSVSRDGCNDPEQNNQTPVLVALVLRTSLLLATRASVLLFFVGIMLINLFLNSLDFAQRYSGQKIIAGKTRTCRRVSLIAVNLEPQLMKLFVLFSGRFFPQKKNTKKTKTFLANFFATRVNRFKELNHRISIPGPHSSSSSSCIKCLAVVE